MQIQAEQVEILPPDRAQEDRKDLMPLNYIHLLISYESGVDVHDFGKILRTCSLSEIRKAVADLASRPAMELESMARKSWEYARDNHSRDSFATEWRKVLRTILAEHSGAQSVQLSAAVEAR